MQKSTYRFCTGKGMPKIYLLMLLILLSTSPQLLFAQSYKSLPEKVQLQMEQTNVAAVIRSLQQQTSYTFIYDPEYLQQCALTAVKFQGNPLGEVLHYLDQHAPLDIEYVSNRTIAIRKGRAEKKGTAAQGCITGKIVDNKNELLPGVTIQVIGGQGLVSQVDGTYDLKLLPGTYTLLFSYVSYNTHKVTDIIVQENTITPLDIVLKSGQSHLKAVTITANYQKASVEGLYAIQKNNAAITDGISADVIARTPDKNIGEVLKRVSGLATMDNKYVVVRGLSERYNQAVLNGQVMPSTELNRKNFSFDILPANIVENVTVIKTLTPDQSAEFGGGSVVVNTLDIPARNFFNISIGGSYNNNTTGKDFLSIPLEGREYLGLASKSRYLMGSLNWKSKDDILQAFDAHGKDPKIISNNWGISAFKAQPSINTQLAIGQIFAGSRQAEQWGVVASLSYRNTLATQDVRMSRFGFEVSSADSTNMDLVGYDGKRYGFTTNIGGLLGVGYRNAYNKVNFQTMYLRTLDQQLLIGNGGAADVGAALGYFDLTQQTNLWQNQLKGEHALGSKGIKLKWMGGYLELDRQRPDNHLLLSNYVQPDPSIINGYNIDNGRGIVGATRLWTRALEKNYTWEAELSKPFKFNALHTGFENILKVGYSGWHKDRLFYVLPAYSTFDNKFNSYIPLTSAYTPEYGGQFDFDRRFNDNFHRAADLHAVYAMLDNRIGNKWRLVWGVRAEYYNLNNTNARLDSLEAAYTRNSGGTTQFDYSAIKNQEPNLRFFPSANLTYSLTSAMNLRLAYAQSIIRPDLRDLSYFQEYDFELGGIYFGGLVRSTTLTHMDFRYEYYPAPGEILSFSLFYKKLDYPMEIYKMGDNLEYQLRNNKLANNYGLEVEARKSFAFTKIPVLRNVTLYGNVTLLKARVKPMTLQFTSQPENPGKIIPQEQIGEEENRPQTGASNYMVNAGMYYDIKPVSLSVTYNYVSNRMFRPSLPYRASLFERPLQALDAQVAIRVLKQKAEIKLNVANLLNSYLVVYRNVFADDPAVENGNKAPSTKALLYQKGKDQIDYEAKPGITYSVTLSYRF
jgi:hypothetical protein